LAQNQGALFDAVGKVLQTDYCDASFRVQQVPKLLAQFRPQAIAASSVDQERRVVHELLSHIPASHLALYSTSTSARLEAEIQGQPTPGIGCVLTCSDGRYYLDSVYEGGPAAQAGLRRGDLVLAIDGAAPQSSPRLDWRSDDAFLPDLPVHDLLVDAGQRITLRIERDGVERDIELQAEAVCGLAATREGTRIVTEGDVAALYLHLWFVYHGKAARVLHDAVAAHPDCRALVLDLRGRGGSALECAPLLAELKAIRDRGIAIVALIDSRTRSAKEVVAYELRRHRLATLVGERTAGAMLPATLVPVGADSVLMYPALRAGNYTRAIEGKGIAPHREVADPFPGTPGKDPVLDAALAELRSLLGPR
jgi:carboxyl-terminal processing protease